MTRLVSTLRRLGLTAEIALDGRWIAIRGDRATVYVIESTWGESFFVWCGSPGECAVERYADATEAIQAGLRRARFPSTGPA